MGDRKAPYVLQPRKHNYLHQVYNLSYTLNYALYALDYAGRPQGTKVGLIYNMCT